MKKILLHFVFVLACFSSSAQSKVKLDSIFKQIRAGVFERTIVNAETDKRLKYIGNTVISPRNEVFKLFFRFEQAVDTMKLKEILIIKPEKFDFIIGKVFMSEMYSEINYRKKYKDTATFKNDKDGFFYYYKLYFDKLNDEYRLNIYPSLPTNFCDKNMHWNMFKCLTEIQHQNTTLNIIAIQDYTYIDFLPQSEMIEKSDTLLNMLRADNKISKKLRRNIFKSNTQNLDSQWNSYKKATINLTNIGVIKPYWKLLKNVPERDNLIVSMNVLKDIKCFEINTIGAELKNIRLVHTKYTYSEDLIEKNQYQYSYYSYANYQKFLGENKKKYTLSNSWLKELRYADAPDDKVIKGMVDMNNIALLDSIQYSPDPIAEHIEDEEINEKLNQVKEEIRRLNSLKNNIDSNSVQLGQLKKALINLGKNVAPVTIDLGSTVTQFENYRNNINSQYKGLRRLYAKNLLTMRDLIATQKIKTIINADSILKLNIPKRDSLVNAINLAVQFNGKETDAIISSKIDSVGYQLSNTANFYRAISNDLFGLKDIQNAILKLIQNDTLTISKSIDDLKNLSTNFQDQVTTLSKQKTSLESFSKQKPTSFQPYVKKIDTFYVYLGKQKEFNKSDSFDFSKNLRNDSSIISYLLLNNYYLRDRLPIKENGVYVKGSIIGCHSSTIYKKKFTFRDYQVNYETLKFYGDEHDVVIKKVNYRKFFNRKSDKIENLSEKFVKIQSNRKERLGKSDALDKIKKTIKILKIYQASKSKRDSSLLSYALNEIDTTLVLTNSLKHELKGKKSEYKTAIKKLKSCSIYNFNQLSVWEGYHFKVITPPNEPKYLWLKVTKPKTN